MEEVEGQGEVEEGQVSEAAVPPRTPTRSSTAKMAELDKTFTLSTHRAEKRYPLVVASVQRQPDLQDVLQEKPRILDFFYNIVNMPSMVRLRCLFPVFTLILVLIVSDAKQSPIFSRKSIRERRGTQQSSQNSDQRNALYHLYLAYWDKEGNRLREANGKYLVISMASLLRWHQIRRFSWERGPSPRPL